MMRAQQDASQLTTEQLLAIVGSPAAVAPGPAPAPAPAPVSAPSLQAGSGATPEPLGIRNRNAGNLKDGPFTRSQPGYRGANNGFAVFDTPEAGNAAQEALLAQNYLGAGFTTPRAIVNRYAPPGPENSQASVDNYTQYIAGRLGIDPDGQVSPNQVQALAQAMREFENGQTQGGAPQAPADASGMSTEALMALVGAQPSGAETAAAPPALPPLPSSDGTGPVQQVTGRVQQYEGAPYQPAFSGPGSTHDNPYVLQPVEPNSEADYDQRRALYALPKGAFIARDGQVFQMTAQGYPTEGGELDPSLGGVTTRETNMGDNARAFGMAAMEQLPWGDEAVQAAAGAISGRGFSDTRDSWQAAANIDNQASRGYRVGGGFAGAGTGFLMPGGRYIEGATGAAQVLRAAGVGAGQGFLYGTGNADGGAGERFRSGLLTAAVGAGAGAAVQSGAQGLLNSGRTAAAEAAMNPRPQRILADAGVEMTPGQIFGGLPRTIEDGLAGTIPIVGDAINARRMDGLRSYNRAEINGALGPIGQQLPDTVNVGRDGVQQMRQQISDEYTRVLGPVRVPRDSAFDTALQGIRAGRNLTPTARRELNGIIDNLLERFQGTIDGETWKLIDSDIGKVLNAASRNADNVPAGGVLRDRIGELQTAYRETLRRADPVAADAVAAADEAFANSTRVVDAGQRLGTTAREGIFSPADMNNAVRAGDSSAGNVRFAEGEARMQGVNRAAVEVLPNTVPNSGTPLRAILAGATGLGLAGGATISPVGATVAAGGLLSGSVLYSRTVQGWINAAYRAKTPGQARQALAPLLEAARRDPALLPVYEQALRDVSPGGLGLLDPAPEGMQARQQ